GINYVLKNKNLRLLNYIVLFIILVFLFFFFFKTQTENGEEVFKFLIILALLYVLSYGFVKGILKENLFLYSLAILVFLDIYINFNSYFKIERYSDVESYYKPYFVEYLKANNLGEYRVNARFYKGIILPRNSGNINKIELTEGYDPLVSKYYVEFYDHIVKRKEGFENLLKMANVKYYITDSGFVELKDYLPRAYLVYCAQVIKDSSTFFSNVKNLKVHECVYLNDEPKKTYNLNEFYKPVKILKYTTNEILIEYESDKDAILVLSNSYYPYWKAKLDNREVKILRANWTFMAIEVPKGKHLVKFHYDYKKFVLFLSFWLFGIALSIVFSYFKI
ncbi:MAG: YfhO family protein, partial [candidate division WOR-3 bacterium]